MSCNLSAKSLLNLNFNYKGRFIRLRILNILSFLENINTINFKMCSYLSQKAFNYKLTTFNSGGPTQISIFLFSTPLKMIITQSLALYFVYNFINGLQLFIQMERKMQMPFKFIATDLYVACLHLKFMTKMFQMSQFLLKQQLVLITLFVTEGTCNHKTCQIFKSRFRFRLNSLIFILQNYHFFNPQQTN